MLPGMCLTQSDRVSSPSPSTTIWSWFDPITLLQLRILVRDVYWSPLGQSVVARCWQIADHHPQWFLLPTTTVFTVHWFPGNHNRTHNWRVWHSTVSAQDYHSSSRWRETSIGMSSVCKHKERLPLPTFSLNGNPQTLVEDIVHMQEAQSTVSFTSAHKHTHTHCTSTMDEAGMKERVSDWVIIARDCCTSTWRWEEFHWNQDDYVFWVVIIGDINRIYWSTHWTVIFYWFDTESSSSVSPTTRICLENRFQLNFGTVLEETRKDWQGWSNSQIFPERPGQQQSAHGTEYGWNSHITRPERRWRGRQWWRQAEEEPGAEHRARQSFNPSGGSGL